MTSTATHPGQRRKGTCPFVAIFYTCPPNMSIAWTYHAPSVHFSCDYGQVHWQRHAQFAESAKLEKLVKKNLKGLGHELYNNSVPMGDNVNDQMECAQDCFKRNSWIPPLDSAKTCDKNENRSIASVPTLVRGRYYPHSKPGGPLSQDTHTSSGLSICGLGVGA